MSEIEAIILETARNSITKEVRASEALKEVRSRYKDSGSFPRRTEVTAAIYRLLSTSKLEWTPNHRIVLSKTEE